MPRRQNRAPAPEGAPQRPANPPPPVPVEVSSGLEAIRLHGGRDEELYLTADQAFFEEAFMTDRVVTAEEMVRFIKKIEALVRGSREYKAWVGHLRQDVGLTRCSFLSGLDYSTDEVGLEMHHCPLTLYEIVEIVQNHRFARGHAVTSLSVADEVMRVHLDGHVGVVPLSKTVHKLVHAGTLAVHPLQIHGDWMQFLRDYPDGVNEEVVAKLLQFVQQSEADVVARAAKLDGTGAPRLRADVTVPSRDEIGILLLAPAAR